jgi:hypothetical protein
LSRLVAAARQAAMCGILLIAGAEDGSGATPTDGEGRDEAPSRAPAPLGGQAAGDAPACAGAGAPPQQPAAAPLPAAFAPGLARRGPDAAGALRVPAAPGARLLLAASLLQLRGGGGGGAAPPLAAPSGSVLAFNGEIFGGLPVPRGANDGACLLAALEAAPADGVPALLSALRGPWALVFWRARDRRLWFGRDWLGGCGARCGGCLWAQGNV